MLIKGIFITFHKKQLYVVLKVLDSDRVGARRGHSLAQVGDKVARDGVMDVQIGSHCLRLGHDRIRAGPLPFPFFALA